MLDIQVVTPMSVGKRKKTSRKKFQDEAPDG